VPQADELKDRVFSILNEFYHGAPLLLAVSGGADSMAMLSVLLEAKDRFDLYCLTVDHGIRQAEESRGDADFVFDFCQKNGIKCRIKSIPPGRVSDYSKQKGIGIEAAARHFRRRALFKEAKRIEAIKAKAVFILLAHTKDDLLETVLMRVLRGSGPAGLAAMPFQSGRILRPLLESTRKDVISFLKEKNIAWREDSTNADNQFLRNRIRNLLVPFLNDNFSSWKKGVNAMAQTQTLAAHFIAAEAQKRIKWEKTHCSPCHSVSSVVKKDFFSQPVIIREEAIFQAINTLCDSPSNKSIRRSVVRKFCLGLINSADLGLVTVKRQNDRILISQAQNNCFESGISRLI